MNDLTAFQRDVLYVLAGLDIKDELEEYYTTEIHHGQLYPNLDTLVEKNLVERGQQDKRTNSYALTDSGYRQLEAHRTWENTTLFSSRTQ